MAHMSTRQSARLVRAWVIGLGLPPQDYGTHSPRRIKASIIYKATGNLRAVQILVGHAKIDSTMRHLGVDVENAFDSWFQALMFKKALRERGDHPFCKLFTLNKAA